MAAVHGRMDTVGDINKKQKALVVGAPIISTTELNTGAPLPSRRCARMPMS